MNISILFLILSLFILTSLFIYKKSIVKAPRIGAGALLVKDGKILTVLRGPNVQNPNKYGLIGGLINQNETIKDGIIRIILEETGVTASPEMMTLVHTMHSFENNQKTIGFYFLVEAWDTEPYNKKRDSHIKLEWFNLENLPANLIPRNRQAIENWEKNVSYSEFGWEK
ncbi:NUDIX domain-containing protein [Candidatus Dependentiae bacterium]|nr:NUDIX domain-containing protein [Candidatus Dependentiae bacterium]